MRTLIAQGEHDISSQWLPPEVKKALAEDGNQLLTEGGTGSFYFKMNTGPGTVRRCALPVGYRQRLRLCIGSQTDRGHRRGFGGNRGHRCDYRRHVRGQS